MQNNITSKCYCIISDLRIPVNILRICEAYDVESEHDMQPWRSQASGMSQKIVKSQLVVMFGSQDRDQTLTGE